MASPMGNPTHRTKPLLVLAALGTIAVTAAPRLAPPAQAADPLPAPSVSIAVSVVPAPAAPAPPVPPAAEPAKDSPAHVVTIPGEGGKPRKCREQEVQAFLVRGNWFKGDPKEGQKKLLEAIKYRTEKYGYFEGFGSPRSNPNPPKHYAKATTFMGLPIQIHERVIPALRCVEAALQQSGAAKEYKPDALSGIRFKNTYRGSEVSNHVYGIAIDVDPNKNSCCGCVKPWPDHPLCKKKTTNIFDRMAMPKSWVTAFERYGFYWLGHDVLMDTMHFEFLGDPDKVLEGSP